VQVVLSALVGCALGAPVAEADADAQVLLAKPYINSGSASGPLTPLVGDLVATNRGYASLSLEGFSEDVNEESIRLQQEELARRRDEVRRMDRSHQERGQVGGKRKFEDRMTLTEAKLTDFTDSKDYVDFIQSKLQGVNIKIVK